MTTRPYDDCLAMALALCGIPDANTVEVARVAVYLNGRARKAYNASTYWPRWLKVEERVCSEDGLIPYEEDGLDTIKTALRVHATEPYKDAWAAEYGNYVAQAGGIQVAGYEATEDPRGTSWTINFNGTPFDPYNGDFTYQGTHGNYPFYLKYVSGVLVAALFVADPLLNADLSEEYHYKWLFADTWPATSDSQLFLRTYETEPSATPDLVTAGSWTRLDGNDAYTLLFTELARYSVWVTYKAAFTTTYASGDEVPEEWFDYMAHGAYADWLRGEGQQEKAPIAEAEAQEKLSEQLEMIDRQSGSHVFTRVINHANTQQR